jgi:Flp pilus assembly protein TadG
MRRNHSRSGHSMLELALFMPWLFFVFAGAYDWGHYAYSLISVQSAARVAALYASSGPGTADDAAGACFYALGELRRAPGVGAGTTSCAAWPVVVTAAAVVGPDGEPASAVTVSYRTPPLIPIPGLVPGRLTVTRTVQMRVRG